MTAGQMRHCLRVAEAIGLTTNLQSSGGHPDVFGWRAHDGDSAVTFNLPPVEICPALPDAEHRLMREKREPEARVAAKIREVNALPEELRAYFNRLLLNRSYEQALNIVLERAAEKGAA